MSQQQCEDETTVDNDVIAEPTSLRLMETHFILRIRLGYRSYLVSVIKVDGETGIQTFHQTFANKYEFSYASFNTIKEVIGNSIEHENLRKGDKVRVSTQMGLLSDFIERFKMEGYEHEYDTVNRGGDIFTKTLK